MEISAPCLADTWTVARGCGGLPRRRRFEWV